MKTTKTERENLRKFEVVAVRWLVDDFEEVARQLEDARDRLQQITIELAECRRDLEESRRKTAAYAIAELRRSPLRCDGGAV